jgi:hypothetical protein
MVLWGDLGRKEVTMLKKVGAEMSRQARPITKTRPLLSLIPLCIVPAITLSPEIIDCLSIDLLLIIYANYAGFQGGAGKHQAEDKLLAAYRI